MDIMQAARKLRPGTAWVYKEILDKKTGNVSGQLTQAEDGTPRVTVPSLSELDAVMKAAEYIELRAREYPAITDQLDAIWKGGAEEEAMRAKVQAVKEKYPKPEK